MRNCHAASYCRLSLFCSEVCQDFPEFLVLQFDNAHACVHDDGAAGGVL
jgi:hypothetical protein